MNASLSRQRRASVGERIHLRMKVHEGRSKRFRLSAIFDSSMSPAIQLAETLKRSSVGLSTKLKFPPRKHLFEGGCLLR